MRGDVFFLLQDFLRMIQTITYVIEGLFTFSDASNLSKSLKERFCFNLVSPFSSWDQRKTTLSGRFFSYVTHTRNCSRQTSVGINSNRNRLGKGLAQYHNRFVVNLTIHVHSKAGHCFVLL